MLLWPADGPMDAILAIIADGGRAIIEIYREAVEIIFFSFNL